MIKTYQPKESEVKREWHLVDAKGATLGRLCTQIAIFLMGKHKTTYSTHMDMGDFVVVINAEKIEVSGNKDQKKVYRSNSGFPGGFKEETLEKLRQENRKIL